MATSEPTTPTENTSIQPVNEAVPMTEEQKFFFRSPRMDSAAFCIVSSRDRRDES